jgi:pyruvate/2-oxoglutarate/acetoin dehydrogenase E1 component
MPTYISSLSQLVGTQCARLSRAVLFGENIDTGSRIVGVCRNLVAPEGGRIINVGNCEATHIGAGFGMMLNGVHSVLFAKQQDFMLLGVDHLVNTYNFVRCARRATELGAFTIVAVVCDQGYQGPQSSFNSVGDLCSLARVPGFMLTNAHDAAQVLGGELAKPGFRFIGLSQRLFGTELLDPGFVWAAPDLSVFQYSEGADAAIVCFNFSLPQGWALQEKLREHGLQTSLFSANHVFPLAAERIVENAARAGSIIVIDDSKSTNLAAHRLLHDVASRNPHSRRLLVERGSRVEFGVCHDAMPIDFEAIVAAITSDIRLRQRTAEVAREVRNEKAA